MRQSICKGKDFPEFILLLVVGSLLLSQTQAVFCSSKCIDYVVTCYDSSPEGCMVCASSIYQRPFYIPSEVCTLLPQTELLRKELDNEETMDLTGYHSSQTSTVTLGNYTLSGRYSASDFLSKNFTSFPLNHYSIVVRYNIGFAGPWWQSNSLRLSLTDERDTYVFDKNYKCDYLDFDQDTLRDSTDDVTGLNLTCIRIFQFQLKNHTGSFLLVNFTSGNVEPDSFIQFWGIKELMIVARMCHPACQTCSGPNSDACFACSDGYYLQGTSCRFKCDEGYYRDPQSRLCVTQCPKRFFELNTTSSPFGWQCKPCPSGCLTCTSSTVCQVWEEPDSLWQSKLQLWIILIILLVLCLIFIVYKILKRSLSKVEELQQKLNQNSDNLQKEHSQKSSRIKIKENVFYSDDKEKEASVDLERSNVSSKHQLNDSKSVDSSRNESIIVPEEIDRKFWFNELVELDPEEVKVTHPRRRRIQDQQRGSKEEIDGVVDNSKL